MIYELDSVTIEENANSPEMATFAKTLNSILIENGIQQRDLAKETGIATGSISAYRNGIKEPRLSAIIKMADCLGVDCHYLMTGVKVENKSHNIVHCKNCKYCDWDCKEEDAIVCLRTKYGYWRHPNDFCSYGEKREDQ